MSLTHEALFLSKPIDPTTVTAEYVYSVEARLAKRANTDPLIMAALADVFYTAGIYEKAMIYATKAIKQGHKTRALQALLAELYYINGDYEKARLECEKLLHAEPQHPNASFWRALLLLTQGNFKEGFAAYEKRWLREGHKGRYSAYPRWEGQVLEEKTLLLWGEQGIGEELMFARFVPEMAARCQTLVLECDPRLVPLFVRSFPMVEVIGKEDPLKLKKTPDYQCPIGSLMHWLNVTQEYLNKREKPYLIADKEKSAALRARYVQKRSAPLIGISWYAKNKITGKERSIGFKTLLPLLQLPEMQFISLQYGDVRQALATLQKKTGIEIAYDPAIDAEKNLDDFAAQVAAMDLVISIDNSTVHMAGALGVPTWVLLPYVADWRWMLEREESPWYPSLQLFRQKEKGKWDAVIMRVRHKLLSWVGHAQK